MYGKMQKSELPGKSLLSYASTTGASILCFSQPRAPWGSPWEWPWVWWLLAHRYSSPSWSALCAHQLTLESCSHWWLWHPRLLSRKYSISRGQHEICVLEWFLVQSLEDTYQYGGSGDCCHLRAHVKAPVTDSSCWVVSKAAARSTDFISFLFSHWLLFMEEPREWLLVCAGPAPSWMSMGRAWRSCRSSPEGEWQGGQALWIPSLMTHASTRRSRFHVWSPCSPRANYKIKFIQGAFSWGNYGSFVDESEIFFVMLLKDPEILKDFNFRKIIDSAGKKLSGAVLWSLTFQRLFTLLCIWWLFLLRFILFVFLLVCCT